MKTKTVSKNLALGPEPHSMGTTVMGERGQLVVPKEIREQYNLKSGDKFIIFGHDKGPIVLVPTRQMLHLMEHFNQKIQELLNTEN